MTTNDKSRFEILSDDLVKRFGRSCERLNITQGKVGDRVSVEIVFTILDHSIPTSIADTFDYRDEQGISNLFGIAAGEIEQALQDSWIDEDEHD
ncbi:hypothetical protein [Mesorhizobium sp.]|uniref:hypothetical protein n=1 Tax=Mesorhizobium sp. TaxID=1871066 RepID=UPI000FE454A9|nr:hypothetical protein [Mesorhizobium sp.]RWM29429.1 MAG: hypothetical protein EOR74_07050 [Mesorhizobium sp.]